MTFCTEVRCVHGSGKWQLQMLVQSINSICHSHGKTDAVYSRNELCTKKEIFAFQVALCMRVGFRIPGRGSQLGCTQPLLFCSSLLQCQAVHFQPRPCKHLESAWDVFFPLFRPKADKKFHFAQHARKVAKMGNEASTSLKREYVSKRTRIVLFLFYSRPFCQKRDCLSLYFPVIKRRRYIYYIVPKALRIFFLETAKFQGACTDHIHLEAPWEKWEKFAWQ